MAALASVDLKRLRWNLVLLALMLSIGGVMLSFAIREEKTALQTQRRIEAARSEIRNKLARAQEEEQELRDKIAQYNRLQAKGIIGQEHRLEWVEALRAIKLERRLIDLQYELAPQKPFDATPGSVAEFEFMNSPLKMQMLLLHEGDLLHFISDIRAKPQAYTRVRRCSIQRATVSTRESGPTPQLRADCEIDWITIREKR
ncbi:MAG: hypothetical protein M0P39_16215 [Rhodocyclaceae bacterium]|nr:hypothetical protein [Rhodocyclaceae bacterium]